jgi:hypothetical protein
MEEGMKVPRKKERLAHFVDLYTNAKAAQEETFALLDRHWRQYRGDPTIDGTAGAPAEDASVVRNITYELIESQVTTYVPSAKCTAVSASERSDALSLGIEKMLSSLRDRLNVEEINDFDERCTYIYGAAIYLVEWDESIKTHDTSGGIKLSCLSPRHFVGQPYIYNIEDMEYLFVTFETTKDDLVRKYGVSFETAEETVNETSGDEDTATMVVCFYKDEEDNVCQFIWSGDVVLRDMPNYYSRKREYCRRCEKKKGLCECEKPAFVTVDEEYEELTHDILLSDGVTVIPAVMPVLDEGGEPIYDEAEQPILDETGQTVAAFDEESGLTLPMSEKIPMARSEPTRLPFYKPKRFPVVIRKNTAKEDSVLGQSDCEFIRPQQQAINKVESRIMQKLMRAGVIPYMPEDASVSINNSVFGTVIRVKPGEQHQYGTIDTQPNIQQDIMEADRLYDQAKRVLGISESFQGHYDPSAKSGVAKQTSAMQSAGRLESKRAMKNAAWANIDRIIFELLLAFADEPRPVSYVDTFGKVQEVQFNRYDFLALDDNFKWYFDDEYLFSADASADYATNREAMWAQNLQNLQMGTFGNPQDVRSLHRYWLAQMRAHYPHAQDNVEYFKSEVENQQKMAALQQQMAALAAENDSRRAYENELLGAAKEQEAELRKHEEYSKYVEDEINQMNGEVGANG